jgi:hypothetical protein
MSLPDITITAASVIESTIIYGFVHTFWMIIKWCLKYLSTDAGRIIDTHVKDGHHTRLEHCVEGACVRLETALDSLHRASQPQQRAD